MNLVVCFGPAIEREAYPGDVSANEWVFIARSLALTWRYRERVAIEGA